MSCDLAIEGRFYSPSLGEPVKGCLVVREGRVQTFVKGSCPAGEERIVFSEKQLILPGVIDIHVHLRGLRLSYKEDELSGTLAAAAGGVTLVVDMPNTVPRVDNIDALREKLASLRRNAIVDYGVYAGIPKDPLEAHRLAETGLIVGFKVYPEDLVGSRESIESAAYEAYRRGLLIVLHSEHPGMIREGCKPGERWKCRPISAEIEALQEIISIVPKCARLHVTHASSIELVRKAKELGYTVDVTPHHMLLDSSSEEEMGCVAKVNPPLRPREQREQLLIAVASGVVDAVATDHAPHSVEEKMRDFSECPPGIPSLEHYVRLLLTLVNRGVLGLETFVEITSLRPASVLGLEGYGCIEPGCIPSFTVVDLKKEGRIVGYDTFSKAKLTPYDGWLYRGEPIATIIRGCVVYREGCVCAKPGVGANIAGWIRGSGRRC